MGEFEQAKPILERYKVSSFAKASADRQGTRYTQETSDKVSRYKVVLTFFSPSGYEANKNYPHADFVFYLPLDSARHAKRFLDAIDPALVIWVKYDFWYYYLSELHQRNIPCILISAVFRKQQSFFQWYGVLQKKMLSFFTEIFVQDEKSKQLLKTIGIENCRVSGDTRFDRVIEIAENFKPVPAIENFLQRSKCIVAGSTWKEDEQALKRVYDVFKSQDLKFIIAPHEIHEKRIEELVKIFPGAVKFSEIDNRQSASAKTTAGRLAMDNRQSETRDVLIIDNIGMLSRLYHYGYINYVGGGFTEDGVHNVLEAAVYGKPVLFGPNYNKYREAIELIEAGGAKSFTRDTELSLMIGLLVKDAQFHLQQSTASKNYVRKNKGAAEKILNYIQEKRLLTS